MKRQEVFCLKRNTVEVTGVPVDLLDTEGAASAIRAFVAERRDQAQREDNSAVANRAAATRERAAIVCTPNAEIMMEAQKDAELMRVLRESDLVLADGAGVVLAARILGRGRIPRAPGIDTVRALFASASPESPLSFFFFGGKPGVAESAAAAIQAAHPGARVLGACDGYFTPAEEPAIVSRIAASGADVCLVALGAPKQEKWMAAHRAALAAVPVLMGVGGSLDVFAGTARLAPPFFRRHGLEWLYRLWREPWRARRMLRLPRYILLALRLRLFP